VEGHTRVLEVIGVLVKRDSGRPPTVADAILGFVPLLLLPRLNGVPHNLASGGLVAVVDGEDVVAEGLDGEALVHKVNEVSLLGGLNLIQHPLGRRGELVGRRVSHSRHHFCKNVRECLVCFCFVCC